MKQLKGQKVVTKKEKKKVKRKQNETQNTQVQFKLVPVYFLLYYFFFT